MKKKMLILLMMALSVGVLGLTGCKKDQKKDNAGTVEQIDDKSDGLSAADVASDDSAASKAKNKTNTKPDILDDLDDDDELDSEKNKPKGKAANSSSKNSSKANDGKKYIAFKSNNAAKDAKNDKKSGASGQQSKQNGVPVETDKKGAKLYTSDDVKKILSEAKGNVESNVKPAAENEGKKTAEAAAENKEKKTAKPAAETKEKKTAEAATQTDASSSASKGEIKNEVAKNGVAHDKIVANSQTT